MNIAALLLTLSALAAPADNPFRLEVRDATVAPGTSGMVTVYLVVPARHHVFREVLQVSVTDADGLQVGAPVYPPGVMVPDTTGTNGGLPRESYESDVLVDVPVTVPTGTPPGTRDLGLHVRYQGCNEKSCFFPREEDLRAQVEVRGAPPASPSPTGAPSPASAPSVPSTPPRTGCHTGTAGDLSLVALALALPALVRTRCPR